MDKAEMGMVNARLKALYEERFIGLTPAMALVWLEVLKPFSLPIVYATIVQWARSNTFRAPGVEDLAALAVDLEDEEETARRRLQASLRPSGSAQSYDEVLAQAAEATPFNGRIWARLHMEMVSKGVTVPGRYGEAAAMCEQFATQHPTEAQAWHIEAAWWRSGAHGVPYFGREREHEETPDAHP